MKRMKLLDKYHKDFLNGSKFAIAVGIFLIIMGIIFTIDDGEITILTAFILLFGILDVVGGLLRLKFLNQYAEKFNEFILNIWH